ncbi:MAG: hypothetical protein KJO84_06760, partial [Acidimicrobiia bacterium]|nr:hypothetical protein [Acidimicrobiia bacterium]
RTYGPGEVPSPLRWRPRVSIIGIILGTLGGLGFVIYLQQSGWLVLDRALSLQGLIGGALSGILIPSVIYAFTVRRYNKRLSAFTGKTRPRTATAMVWLLAVPLVAALVSATPALATVEGPCTVTINGIDIGGLQPTADDAIVVQEADLLVGQVTHPSEWQAGSIDLHYAGFSVTIVDEFDEVVNDEDAVDTGASISVGSAEVADLATYGTGVYAFFGAAVMESGAECSASFAIKLDKPALETPIGIAAAATAAIGAVAAAGVAINGIREGSGLVGGLEDHLGGLGTPPSAGGDTYTDEEIGGAVMDALEDLPIGEPTGTPPGEVPDTYTDEEIGGAAMDALEDLPIGEAGDGTGADTSPTQPVEPDGTGSDPTTEAAGGETPETPPEGTDTPPPPTEGGVGVAPAGGWASAEDGSNFLGRDTADSVSSGIQAINDAGTRLDELASDLEISEETRNEVKDRLQPASDRLGTIKDNVDLFRDTVDRAGEISDDVTRRLDRLGVNQRGQDAITWMRWMTEGVGNYVEDVKNEYMRPFTERLASMFGGEADDYASALVPVGDFGREMGEFVTTAAENVKGGDNYAGQLGDLADVPPEDPFAGIDEVYRFP